MGRLTLRLPDTLHQKLVSLAEEEGVSLNHFIVYALTQQVTLAYTVQPVSRSVRQQEEAAYTALLQSLGPASFEEVRMALEEREVVYPERALTADVIQRLRERIAKASGELESGKEPMQYMTAGQLQNSDLIGMWEDREDIEDSASYARELREQAQQREDVTDNSDE